jgi:hypothetical protein
MCGVYTGEYELENVMEQILYGELTSEDYELIEDVEACSKRGDAGYSIVEFDGNKFKLFYDWGETLCEVEVL